MKLIEVLSQSRRDFKGRYQCEFCGNIDTDQGMDSYDDRNYHDNVIPNQKCTKCGKSTISENGEIDNTPTKYPEHLQL